MKVLQANPEHIDAVLKLQEKYHVSNLTEEEKQTKGFVTIKMSASQLLDLVEKRGVFIAMTEAQELAGYAMSGDWTYWGDREILQKLATILPTCPLSGKDLTVQNTCHYGPVCIDEAFRGQGILTQLFSAVQAYYALQYPFVITFINRQNERSMHAHARRTPLRIVGDFDFNGNQYAALACPT
jgi:hypothetical protein